MGTVLVILDGLADEPAAALGGRTPLEAAPTPHLDRLAAAGRAGRFDPTPAGADPGSEVGVPACLGLPAGPARPARARIEALGRGVPVAPGEAVFRATCVYVSGAPDARLLGVADPDATFAAVAALVPELAAQGARLHPDPRGRHLIVLPGAPDRATVPPHDLAGLPLAAGGPRPRADLWTWIDRRLPTGLALWPWGGGGEVPERADGPFDTLITGVDLVRGLGRAFGLACPRVPGATGGPDSDFGAKARAALANLRHGPVAVHVEAPDMAAHRRDPVAKAAVIARVDRDLIGPLAGAGVRLAVTADHATSSTTGRHRGGPVPYLLAEPGARGPRVAGAFSEAALAAAPVLDAAAWRALLAEVPVPC